MLKMFEPTSFFYLYLYPIVSSIIAGFIFWFIFSYLPERKRNASFSIGVTNDLLKVNSILFGYIDLFMSAQNHSPSRFQNKIHSCTLTEEEINTALQNKILNESFKYYSTISDRLMCIGNEIQSYQFDLDEVIKRLYSFNFYLSANEIQILRNIHEKIFRYSLKMQGTDIINNINYPAVDPSISYMTGVLLELQSDYAELRKIVFKSNLVERTFIHNKIMFYFHSKKYVECIKTCQNWIDKFPFDSELQISFKAKSLFSLGLNNLAYTQLDLFLTKNPNLISNRDFLYPLLSDSVAYTLILKNSSQEKIDELRRVVERESLFEKSFLVSNVELKQFYSAQK